VRFVPFSDTLFIRLSFSRVIVNSLHIFYGATNHDRNTGLVTILNVIATIAVTEIANIVKRKSSGYF
jgi:hypothetical protein